MRRPALPFLVALAGMIVPAVVGLAPAAKAGYQPIAGLPAFGVGLDAGMAASPEPVNPPPRVELKKIPTRHVLNDAPGGSMTPPPSGTGGPGPTPGLAPPVEVPTVNLVVYYRESADRLDLPSSSTFLLDPPRS